MDTTLKIAKIIYLIRKKEVYSPIYDDWNFVCVLKNCIKLVKKWKDSR